MSIELKDATIGYKDKVICRFQDMKFPETGIVCIIGKNGVGKTTLFRTLTKEIDLLSGSITYDGIELKDMSIKDVAKKQCFIPQNLNSNVNMSAMAWIMLGLAPHHDIFYVPSDEDIKKVYDVSKSFNMKELLNSPIKQLSGGEFRRAAVVRALLQGSNIWLLDEIYSQMDLDASIHMRKLLRSQARSKLVLIATHDLQTAIRTSDKLLMMFTNKTAELVDSNNVSDSLLESVYDTPFTINQSRKVSLIDDGKWITH